MEEGRKKIEGMKKEDGGKEERKKEDRGKEERR